RPKGTPPPRHLLLTPPSLHTTTPAPKGDTTTAAPHGDTTTPAPAGDTTTPMPQRDTTTPLLSTATLAPSRRIIRFSLSFRIMNRSFRSSLLDPFSTYYQELELTIHIMVSTAAPPSPPCQRGRLPAPGWGASQGAPASCHVTSLRASGAPLVPGWGIALLVLVCILLVLSILIFILLIVCSRLRKNRGKLDLLSSQTLYEPRSEYPNYHTYGRFSTPDKK
uniref:Mucin-1 n=1 Tax=Gopherus evgoodei TaxID=1825980 RepID=A0A8C4W6N8_9SAUR